MASTIRLTTLGNPESVHFVRTLGPSGGGISGTTSEALTTSDVATRLFSGSRATSETPQTSDSASRQLSVQRATAESPTTLDVAAASVSKSALLTVNAILLKIQSKSLTADAWLKRIQARGLTLDAYLDVAFVKHDRTAAHFGVDHSLDHVLAQGFDRYAWRDNLHEVLSDMDARITDLEVSRRLRVSRLSRLSLNAVIKGSRTASLMLDAVLV